MQTKTYYRNNILKNVILLEQKGVPTYRNKFDFVHNGYNLLVIGRIYFIPFLFLFFIFYFKNNKICFIFLFFYIKKSILLIIIFKLFYK